MVGQFRRGRPVTAEAVAVADDAIGFRIQAAHQGSPRGPANGILGISPVKAHALGGQPVEMRGVVLQSRIRTYAGIEIVRDDEQDVEGFPRERQRSGEEACQDEEAIGCVHKVWEFTEFPRGGGTFKVFVRMISP